MKKPAVTTLDLPAVEAVLNMGSGYVLNFSNRSFAMFFADLGIDIDLAYPDGSKANRLRDFLRSEAPAVVGRVLQALLAQRGTRDDDEALSKQLARYKNLVLRLSGSTVRMPEPPVAADLLSLAYVAELEGKIDQRMSIADHEGAVTLARTLLESVLVELEVRITGQRHDHKRDLQGQFTVVRKLLRIDEERGDLDDNFKTMIRGLVQVVNGLAPLRNKMSDGHARERKPAAHHARFVANASKTAAYFLVESYLYQCERELLSVPNRERTA